MLQIKVYVCYKSLSNHARIQINALKNQKLISRENHRKTIKVINVFCVKCAPANGIIKGAAMAHNNRSFLVRHADH